MNLVRLLVFLGCAGLVQAAETETLTLRLTRVFDDAWERQDLTALYNQFDPDCVYKTPFRCEVGRDAVRDHVFRNVPRFRQNVSTEDFSKVEETIAYSTGVTTFNEYDKAGVFKAKWVARYLHIFTRRPGEDWKMRFHVVHEDSGHPASPAPAKQPG